MVYYRLLWEKITLNIEGDLAGVFDQVQSGTLDPNDTISIAAAQELLARVEKHMRENNHIAVVELKGPNKTSTPEIED